ADVVAQGSDVWDDNLVQKIGWFHWLTLSGKKRRTSIGESHIGAALVPPEPTKRDGTRDTGAEIFTAGASRQKRRVDPLDVDATVLHCLDAARDFDQLACGDIGTGEGARRDESHAAILSSLSAPRMTTLSASSGNGRCSAFASSHGARIQTSRSSSVVKITGI